MGLGNRLQALTVRCSDCYPQGLEHQELLTWPQQCSRLPLTRHGHPDPPARYRHYSGQMAHHQGHAHVQRRHWIVNFGSKSFAMYGTGHP